MKAKSKTKTTQMSSGPNVVVQVAELGREARFSFADLCASDLGPDEKMHAEAMRIAGIRARSSAPDAGDVAFLLDAHAALQRVLKQAVEERDRAQWAGRVLLQRLRRAQGRVVGATEADLKRVLKGGV